MVFVALLRGINVGGNCTVNMKELKNYFEELGYKGVKTYINSGNVIFQVSGKSQRVLEYEIEKLLESRYSFRIRVLVRDIHEIKKLLESVPVMWNVQREWKNNIIFLSPLIDSSDILHNFFPKTEIEEVYYHPGALLWSAKSSDLTHSTMIKINKSPLYKEMTVRGLNTINKIYQIMNSLQNELIVAKNSSNRS